MADLWIYQRKPAALVRHRHGGFNATFPMNGDTVVEQMDRTIALNAAQEREALAEANNPPPVEGHDAQNVLRFQPRAARGQHAGGPSRSGTRPQNYRD